MSRLAEFRAAEEQLRTQLQLLEDLKKDSSLQQDMQFEDKLQVLMAEYHMNLGDILAIFEPKALGRAKTQKPHPEDTPTKRRVRVAKLYRNPETGETLQTKGGNHKLLKAWKAQYGASKVEGWVQ